MSADPRPAPANRNGRAPFTRRERDFLLLNIFVLAQNGFPERAAVLAEAMHAHGDDGADVTLARAVLRFSAKRWRETLDVLDALDRIDPIERFGAYRLTERQRMRRYLKMRCLHELGDTARARDALEAYLRHGEEGLEIPE